MRSSGKPWWLLWASEEVGSEVPVSSSPMRMRPHTRTHCSRKGECEGEVVRKRFPYISTNSISFLSIRIFVKISKVFSNNFFHQTRCPGGRGGANRQLALVELPAELLIKILEYMTFKVKHHH